MVGSFEPNRPNSSFRSCNWDIEMNDTVTLLKVDTRRVATHFPATVGQLCQGAEVESRASKSAFSHGESDSFPIFRVVDYPIDVN